MSTSRRISHPVGDARPETPRGPSVTPIKRPYEFQSAKFGRMWLYTVCFPRCERGTWSHGLGVECNRCGRVFDPDFPENDPCAGCRTPIKECWGAADGDGETFYCDSCSGFEVSVDAK